MPVSSHTTRNFTLSEKKKCEQRLQQQMTLDFVATDFSLGTQKKTECLSGKVKNGCFFNHLKGYAQHLSDANIVIVNRTVTNIHSLARSVASTHILKYSFCRLRPQQNTLRSFVISLRFISSYLLFYISCLLMHSCKRNAIAPWLLALFHVIAVRCDFWFDGAFECICSICVCVVCCRLRVNCTGAGFPWGLISKSPPAW